MTDAILFEKFKEEGNSDIYSRLFKRISPICFYRAGRILGSSASCKMEAEDIISESFYIAYERRQHFARIEQFQAFLHYTIRNKCLNVLRHREPVAKYSDWIRSIDHEQAEMEEKQYLELKEEILDRLLDEIGRLPKQQRQILIYTYKGMDDHAIAEKLGISVKTVSNTKTVAKKKLREMLNDRRAITLLSFLLTSTELAAHHQ